MQTDQILSAPLLDIIFEGRNKAEVSIALAFLHAIPDQFPAGIYAFLHIGDGFFYQYTKCIGEFLYLWWERREEFVRGLFGRHTIETEIIPRGWRT